jgi:8-oxo-dGTP diphosphatase
MEELGIEIDQVRFAVCMNMLIEGKHYLDVSFTADLISGEPIIREPERIAAVAWFPLDQLPEPLFEPVRVVLEALRTGERYFEVGA